MDSSDEKDEPPKKRVKRDKFKGLRTRIGEINVDAYKSLVRVEDKPFGEADSFFQERLDHWKEMDVTSNFKDIVLGLAPITGSLYQVIHHRDEIFQIVSDQCTAKASASIEGIGELIAGLARDLQGEKSQTLYNWQLIARLEVSLHCTHEHVIHLQVLSKMRSAVNHTVATKNSVIFFWASYALNLCFQKCFSRYSQVL